MKDWQRSLIIIACIIFVPYVITACGSQANQPTVKPESVQRPRLEFIFESEDRKIYLDNQSININKEKTIANYWTKVVLGPNAQKEAPAFNNTKPAYTMILDELLIGNRKTRYVEIIIYASDNKVLDTVNNPSPLEWKNVVPQSNGETLYEAVMTRLKESKAIK